MRKSALSQPKNSYCPQTATSSHALNMKLSERKHLLMPFSIKQKGEKNLNINRYYFYTFKENYLQHWMLNPKLFLRFVMRKLSSNRP